MDINPRQPPPNAGSTVTIALDEALETLSLLARDVERLDEMFCPGNRLQGTKNQHEVISELCALNLALTNARQYVKRCQDLCEAAI